MKKSSHDDGHLKEVSRGRKSSSLEKCDLRVSDEAHSNHRHSQLSEYGGHVAVWCDNLRLEGIPALPPR